MRWVACLLALLIAGAVARGAGDDADQVRRLVAHLASTDFREREIATRELDRLGESALEPLRQAVRTADPETKQRAVALVERIDRRQAAARVLAPTLVTLNYDHVPLADAVADLARRTGMSIVIHAAAGEVARRPVTVFAENAPTWQAVELFCHQAGLHQWDGYSPSSSPHAAFEKISHSMHDNEGMVVLGQLQVRRGQLSALTVPSPQFHIDLIDGNSGAGSLPTHYSGSLRVRAAPPGAPFPAETGKDICLVLQTSAEARLHVDGATDLRVVRAVDEQGHQRTGRPVWGDPPDDRDDWPRGFRPPPQLLDRKHGPVAIRFERGDSSPKRLRELVGVLTVQAFVIEPVLEVAAPAGAIGRIVRDGDVAFTVRSFACPEKEDVRIAAEAQLPYVTRLENPVTGLVGFPGRGFGRAWAGFVPDEPDPVSISAEAYQGISVFDANGRRFTATSGATEIVGLFPKHYTVRIAATFRPPTGAKGFGPPARIGFAVARPTTVDVPFVLRDVPLTGDHGP